MKGVVPKETASYSYADEIAVLDKRARNFFDIPAGSSELAEELRHADWAIMYPKLLAYAARVVRRVNLKNSEVDANDLVQTSIAKLFSGNRVYKKEVPLLDFLFGIIKSDVYHISSSYKIRNSSNFDIEYDTVLNAMDKNVDLEAEIIAKNQVEDILSFISELSDDLLLEYAKLIIDDKVSGSKETCSVMNISIDRYYYLNKKFRRAIEKYNQVRNIENPVNIRNKAF